MFVGKICTFAYSHKILYNFTEKITSTNKDNTNQTSHRINDTSVPNFPKVSSNILVIIRPLDLGVFVQSMKKCLMYFIMY